MKFFIIIYFDNLSTVKMSKNSVLHGGSKHINVRFHFLRDLCKEGTIELNFCQSDEQIIDLLTQSPWNNHCSRNIEERYQSAESKIWFKKMKWGPKLISKKFNSREGVEGLLAYKCIGTCIYKYMEVHSFMFN